MKDEEKLRDTKQRRLVYEAVMHHKDHPDADQIYIDVRALEPKISKATVYRNLRILTESGIITHVRLSGADRYDKKRDDHYHMLCGICGVVVDAPIEYQSAHDDFVRKATGFQVKCHRTVFEGICPSCHRVIEGMKAQRMRMEAKNAAAQADAADETASVQKSGAEERYAVSPMRSVDGPYVPPEESGKTPPKRSPNEPYRKEWALRMENNVGADWKLGAETGAAQWQNKRKRSLTFIGYLNCSTSSRAQKWLETNGIGYEFRDIKDECPSKEELRAWVIRSGLPLKRFFNTSGMKYRELNLKEALPKMDEDAQMDLLASNGLLIRRPILVADDFVLVGFSEEEWKKNLL